MINFINLILYGKDPGHSYFATPMISYLLNFILYLNFVIISLIHLFDFKSLKVDEDC